MVVLKIVLEKLTYASALLKRDAKQMEKERFNSAQLERLTVEHDKKRRSCNLIIYGEREVTNDDVIMHNILYNIGMDPKLEYKVMRIGQKVLGKTRPLKVIFKSENDKMKVMANLSKLKGKPRFNGVSITNDYPPLERKLIKEWVEKAKELTSRSTKCEFKVCGNINDGLYFKRFWKKKGDKENHAIEVRKKNSSASDS